MTKKIFKSILAVSVMAALICVSCISAMLYSYFGEITEDELKTEEAIIERAIADDSGYLNDMDAISNRVTLVASDGTVLFDSHADASGMANHRNREEISEAIADGEAYSTRYSDTLATKTIYYAKRLDDGSVLRVSRDQSVVAMLLKGIVGPLILLLALVFIAALIVSRIMARRIVTPVNDIDLGDAEAEEPYPELTPLMTRIRQQNERISAQMDELRRTRNEFMTITENMGEGFLLLDRDMEILSHNTAALRLLGAPEDISDVRGAFEINRSLGFRTAVERALAGESSRQALETENRYYQIIANPVTENGSVIGAVIIIVDATEREQRESLRREFTSNVSHELKTPLTTIYGVSDMMAEGIVKDSDVMSFAGNIRDESKRMIDLIDDIIKLSRLDEDSWSEDSTRVDLHETAKEVIDRLSVKAGEKGVSLFLDGGRAEIDGIESLCGEIIYNLCDNGIKYNKEGGSVTVSTEIGEGGEAVLTVTDTGIGIPFEYHDRIFERFFRGDKNHGRGADGTGLGLSIVKHAVSYMGGTIDVDSVDGGGTKMTVRFSS